MIRFSRIFPRRHRSNLRPVSWSGYSKDQRLEAQFFLTLDLGLVQIHAQAWQLERMPAARFVLPEACIALRTSAHYRLRVTANEEPRPRRIRGVVKR